MLIATAGRAVAKCSISLTRRRKRPEAGSQRSLERTATRKSAAAGDVFEFSAVATSAVRAFLALNPLPAVKSQIAAQLLSHPDESRTVFGGVYAS
jgi:hypothetical protein